MASSLTALVALSLRSAIALSLSLSALSICAYPALADDRAGLVQQGAFAVPAQFSPPESTVWQRPTEIFRVPDTTSTMSSSSNVISGASNLISPVLPGAYGLGGYGSANSTAYGAVPVAVPAAVPYAGWGGYGLGYRGSGYWGGYGIPGYWGTSSCLPWGFGSGYRYGGFAGYGYGYGYGYGGYGPGFGWGGFANPGASALFLGAFGDRINANNLGVVTPSRVIQTAPSKPSGNYYAPSTVDSSASGGYYASSQPGATPVYQSPQPQPKDYWGSSGSPFPKDLTSTPWSK